MSNEPMRLEQSQSAETLQHAESETAPTRRKTFTVASLTKAGASAAATVAARALGIGALGIVLGAVAFFVERGTGLLAHSWEPWSYVVYALLPAYMAVGAFGLGAAGMWRGIGRAAMNLVEEHKLTQYIVNRVFEQAAILSTGTATPEVLRRPLPIQALRELLTRAIARYNQSDDAEKGLRGLSRAIFRRLKLRVCRLVESRLIEIIGEQTRDQGVVELTLARLQELAEKELDGQVMDALDGARNKQALLWGALFVGGVALPPLVLMLLR